MFLDTDGEGGSRSGRNECGDLVEIRGVVVTETSARNTAVVFNADEQPSRFHARSVCEAHDCLDEFAVVLRRPPLSLELDIVSFAASYEAAQLLRGHGHHCFNDSPPSRMHPPRPEATRHRPAMNCTARVIAHIRSMLDRYDPRDDGPQDARDGGRDLDRGGGGGGDAPGPRDRNPRDVFTGDPALPRGREREPVRDRDRVYDIDGSEARMLATVGSFRVVAEHDLAALRDDARKPKQSIRHLEDEGLIRGSPLDANDRAVVLSDQGRDTSQFAFGGIAALR